TGQKDQPGVGHFLGALVGTGRAVRLTEKGTHAPLEVSGRSRPWSTGAGPNRNCSPRPRWSLFRVWGKMSEEFSSAPERRAMNHTPAIDTNVPHSARVWNYWLGGKDNYPVDREAGDAFLEIFPGMAQGARASRAFLGRTVRYLAGEAGLRQFLDVGTGLPTADNTHEVAQAVAPNSR